MLPDEKLSELEQAESRMTAAPWSGDHCDGDVWVETDWETGAESICQEVLSEEDAAGIALLRNNAKALLSAARRCVELEAENASLRAAARKILPEVSCLLRQACLNVETMGPGHSTKRAYDELRAALSGEADGD